MDIMAGLYPEWSCLFFKSPRCIFLKINPPEGCIIQACIQSEPSGRYANANAEEFKILSKVLKYILSIHLLLLFKKV
ncbi:MAG: hypothetical protein A2X25_12540 [Chloroflexi bacterium GWB2_49_20]|nr:MAG: hypothetical protein A2X25_12540 [Chloroflexi bacterium GWB2_49_20]OGN78451.1 MAG: hypothetical protein A2X26_01660 [Chloroflexi bacterium GWC2_49_37]OGN84086.1 MAG: hypothetical protein A2X27_14025 [Chloroflexi bacterium GWD2_49_16]HBG75268.1 hypothetical protein [Anaerolineae bacterium]HCM97430.1 hypothetical protein [Anaerolineae bacterium]